MPSYRVPDLSKIKNYAFFAVSPSKFTVPTDSEKSDHELSTWHFQSTGLH